jgi:hypothetical protein
VKNLIFAFLVVLPPVSTYASTSKSQTVATSVCKLALENIELLKMSQEAEPWFKNSTASLSLNLTRIVVDHIRGSSTLNQKYFRIKNDFLRDLYAYSKPKMKEDLSFYVISRTPPKIEEGVMDYISNLVDLTLDVFYRDNTEIGAATLSSVNHILNAMTSRSADAVMLVVAELEVQHPSDYIEFKNSTEIHTIFMLKSEVERIKLEVERVRELPGPVSPRLEGLVHQKIALINSYTVRRDSLYSRLMKENKKDELYAAQGLFGSD